MARAGDGRFEGKVAVVTGSSGGIGLEIARQFATAGASVVTNSRVAERARQAAKEIEDGGGRAIGVEADISTWEGARALVGAVTSAFGGLDILVSNAGISMIAAAQDLDPKEWERTLRTDLFGPFYCARAAFPALKERGGGVIVNIGSVAGHVGLPHRAAYCAAKHGLVGLTKVLALDWASEGIRVVGIDPAYIKTAMDTQDQATAGYDDDAIARRTPLGRFGSVSEVASLALLAAGPEGSYVTGSSILVDGGWSAYGYL